MLDEAALSYQHAEGSPTTLSASVAPTGFYDIANGCTELDFVSRCESGPNRTTCLFRSATPEILENVLHWPQFSRSPDRQEYSMPRPPNFKQDKKRREEAQKKKNELKQQQKAARKNPPVDPGTNSSRS